MAGLEETINKLNNMSKTLMTAAGTSLGLGSYESPRTTVEEIQTEGVLCSSFETYQEEDLEW